MKINSLRLADVIAGQCERSTAGGVLHGEIQKDPRLRELLWFLEFKSRTPGKLEELLMQAAAPTKGWPDPNEQFQNTVQFLCDGTGGFASSGKCPHAITARIYKQMDEHAVASKAALAETKVSNLILRELDLALRHKVPVPIIGDSRFGKTKAVTVWNEMRPGLTRVVTVPESNRDSDFFAAHADALGIDQNDRTTLQRLKREVQHVIKNSGFFICYDEAHFLTPVNYHSNTPPKRINWVRCQVIDKGVGCAFFATPQSHTQTLEKYAARTKYNLEQWIGRLAPPLVLADFYDRDELMAVAKVHFGEFPEKLLALICARAMQSEAYLKGMEFTARYASALAQERIPTIQHVEEAIRRMMPAKPAANGSAPVTAQPLHRDFKPVETPRLPGRSVRPVATEDRELVEA